TLFRSPRRAGRWSSSPTSWPSPGKSPTTWSSWTAASSSNRATPIPCCASRARNAPGNSCTACSTRSDPPPPRGASRRGAAGATGPPGIGPGNPLRTASAAHSVTSMAKNTAEQQAEKISSGYTFEGGSITLGAALVDGQVHREAHVRLPLKMMTRHGLVAGATGTGKTITLQVMAEQLSTAGVPVFLADVKGDLTGLSTPGAASDKLLARTQSVGMDWQAASFPVGYYSLGGSGEGVPIRATVSSFGPVLLARIM